MNTKDKLIHALTQYDWRQSKKKGYNHHALGIYFLRVDDVIKDIEAGATPRAAIIAGFCGRLADVCLRAVGEPVTTRDEQMTRGPWHYVPASERVTP